MPHHTPAARALTRKQARELADKEARKLVGTNAETAFQMLERGELKGSVAADQLGMLKSLLASG